jgi:hypothetical protein
LGTDGGDNHAAADVGQEFAAGVWRFHNKWSGNSEAAPC